MSPTTDHHHPYEERATVRNLSTTIEFLVRFSTNTYGWHHWVFDQTDVAAQVGILELGCGTGDLWQKNLERIPQSWEITLSDASLSMMQAARAPAA